MATTAAMISRSPVSAPTGRAPARHSLIPLYWAGLCEAVNMAPGASRLPDAKYSSSVEVSPRSTTSTPAEVTPSAKARVSSDTGRPHVPGRPAPVRRPQSAANAAPTARARSVFI